MIKYSIATICLVLFMNFGQSQVTQKPDKLDKTKIVYVFDPICTWCYGFSEVITAYHKNNKDKFEFDVVSGGMITGERVGSINDVAPFLKTAYNRVENTTGIKFGQAYLNKLQVGTTVLNSLPPSIALAVFQEELPQHSFEFAKAIQKAIYFDGVEPENVEDFADYAVKLGYSSKSAFVKKVKEEKYLKVAQNNFQKARSLNATSYPTILIEKNGTYQIVSSGYVSYDELESKMLKALK